MATHTHHAAPNWATQRHYLTEALKHLSAFTDNMQTFLELADEADHVAFVQQLQFDTTATTLTVVPEAEPHRRMAEAPNRNREWSEREQEDLRQMLRYGLEDEAIGEFLGRSVKSVAIRRQRLGLLRK